MDFESGQLVTEYTGPELDKEKAKALRAEGKDQYIRSLKNGYCIDGNPYPAVGEGCAQMANDGFPDGVPNNCEFVVLHNRDSVQEKPRVYLKTLRPIKAGEELLASYGRLYWDIHLASSEEDPKTKKKKEEQRKRAREQGDLDDESDRLASDEADSDIDGDDDEGDEISDLQKHQQQDMEEEHEKSGCSEELEEASPYEKKFVVELEKYICVACGDSEEEQTRVVQCSHCKNFFHQECASKTYVGGSISWSCDDCRSKRKKSKRNAKTEHSSDSDN